MWLGDITCMTTQIVWYNSKWGRIQRKENVCTVCLRLCAHAWVKLCALTCCMGICCCIALTCCHVLTCDWRQQVVWVGAAAPRVFFNSKYLFSSARACYIQHVNPSVWIMHNRVCTWYLGTHACAHTHTHTHTHTHRHTHTYAHAHTLHSAHWQLVAIVR